MSRSEQANSDDRLERQASLLREPNRALPVELRSRLQAIGSASAIETVSDPADDAEIDRLYAVALQAAEDDTGDAGLGVEAAAPRSAVVDLLTAVFRDARRMRRPPRRLGAGLRALGGGRRPLPRWIAEPRWAAAACWMLAFALTFGTGDAGALLLEAPSALQSKSRQWTRVAGEVFEDVRDETVETLEAGSDLLRSRAVATMSWAEARTERAVRDLDRAWQTITEGLQDPRSKLEAADDEPPRN